MNPARAVLGSVPCLPCTLWRRGQRSRMIVQSTRRPCLSDACYGTPQTAPFAFYLTFYGADVIRRLPCHIILENFGAGACRFGTALRYASLRRRPLRRLWNCDEVLSRPWSCFRTLCVLMMDIWLGQCLENLREGRRTDASPEPAGSSAKVLEDYMTR